MKEIEKALCIFAKELREEIGQLPQDISNDTLCGCVSHIEYLKKNYDYMSSAGMETFDKTFHAWERYRSDEPSWCIHCDEDPVLKISTVPHENVYGDPAFTTITALLKCPDCEGLGSTTAINVDANEEIMGSIKDIMDSVKHKWNETNK